MRLGINCTNFPNTNTVIQYISLDLLANFSPLNAEITSGFPPCDRWFSIRCCSIPRRFISVFRTWLFVTNIILALSLIAVSTATLVFSRLDVHPLCQPTASASHETIFRTGFENFPSNNPCRKVTNLFDIIEVLNTIQLILGVV